MMADTPPLPASPAPVPKPGHGLQISPNLEALLEHDELTRRNSDSPTSASYTNSSTEFPISLPLPPPRKRPSARKIGKRDQDALAMARQRKKTCDPWSDASAQNGSPPESSSRPVTPNPYLNPAPVWNPVTTQLQPDIDDAQTPRQAVKTLVNETRPDTSRSDSRGRPSPSSAFNKVEKFLWIGRDSLNLFSAAGSKRNESDRRKDHAEGGELLDAVQDRQMWQTPAQNASRPASRSGDNVTATSPSLPLEQSETASACSISVYSDSGLTDRSSPRTTHLLPRLSLPLPTMSHDLPRPKSADGVTGHDYLSFIDFFSQSTSDLSNVQDKPQDRPSSRRLPRPISIPSSSIYSTSSANNSSLSLATMRFAPPSPTLLAVQQPSPVYSPSESVFSSMVFAPPSPTSDPNSAWLQPPSSPPSPYSPLEFAPAPGSPEGVILKPSLLASELAIERGRRFKPGKRSVSLSPHPVHKPLSPLPPTTNQLRANERADRVRRTRKLTRVFGRTPGTDDPASDVDVPRLFKKSHSPSLAGLLTRQKSNHRHAVSVSVAVKSPVTKTEPCSPWQSDDLWSPDGRRHSIPLTTAGPFTLYVDNEQQGEDVKSPRRTRKIVDSPETTSTRSFIDLSDEDDDASGLSFLAPSHLQSRRIHQSNSTPSLVESVNSEVRLEAEKRRKREKLAKLHRCLGSRVPPEAIIENVVGHAVPPSEDSLRASKDVVPDDFDRGKEELNGKEKALNVRRAQKMERVFGTPPPQILYHTRPTRPTVLTSQPTAPTNPNPYVLTLDLPSTSRNPNQSAYLGKTIHGRGPSDSSQNLLPHDTPQSSPPSFAQSFAASFAESLSGYQQVLAQSTVYLNYQHSLNSLVDIIDRDDRQSLVELHRFLHGEVGESPSEDDVTVSSRRSSIVTTKSERRHSLPSRSSMVSLSSELSPRISRFQIRRRKAAKLTNFFGVDYHELIYDILSSIEKGVEEERKRGTLQPQEVEVLMHRVRSLRSVKDPLSR